MGIVWPKKTLYLAAVLILLAVLTVSLFFVLQKPVSIEVDGKVIKSQVFFTSTVQEVLKKKHINLGQEDEISPSLSSPVKRDTHIVITRAFKVKVIADGQSREVLSTPIDVKEAIKLAGFKLGEKDIVQTIPTHKTVPGQEIEIIRVTQEDVQLEEPVPCGIEKTLDNTLERGLTRTISPGQNGVALNTIRITYYNGEEQKREVVDSKMLVEPKNKVVALGNITSVSRGGNRLDFREARYMAASAYTYTGHRTATGRQPAVGMVAVDPQVIPLGSRIYVEGYGYAEAADTGGSIRGDRIDLFMEEHSQCIAWGRRQVKVYILN